MHRASYCSCAMLCGTRCEPMREARNILVATHACWQECEVYRYIAHVTCVGDKAVRPAASSRYITVTWEQMLRKRWTICYSRGTHRRNEDENDYFIFKMHLHNILSKDRRFTTIFQHCVQRLLRPSTPEPKPMPARK